MYRALYRKWRPCVFTDVAGQPHITVTLQNEVSAGRLSHAYLFTGSRGTGKTTCAKILAKAVNCLNPQNGNPCNECAMCRGIDDGSVLDVTEIDAASNNSVDDVRELREEVGFTPSSAKFRVYIIDEVHMLSTGAFNALLKTLEEPPEYVLFILATTEVHKLPATVLSRCQRFDFRRIPAEDIASRLMFVAKEENIELSEGAAMLIARVSDGALRDALSLLDQCSGHEESVTEELVGRVAGLLGRDYLFEISDAVLTGDSQAALGVLDRLHGSSCDMERLINELVNHFRNIMITKAVAHPETMIICTPDELNRLAASAKDYTFASLLSILNTLCSAADGLKRSMNQRVQTEALLLRLCTPSVADDTDALKRRISELERDVKRLAAGTVPVGVQGGTQSQGKATAATPQVIERTVAKEEPKRSVVPTEPEKAPVAVQESVAVQASASASDSDAPPWNDSDAPFVFSADADDDVEQSSDEADGTEPLEGQFSLMEDIGTQTDTEAYAEPEVEQSPTVGDAGNAGAVLAEAAPVQLASENSAEMFTQWPLVLEELNHTSPMLHAALVGSTASKNGGVLEIKAKNNAFEIIFNQPGCREAVEKAIYAATGEELKPCVEGKAVNQAAVKKATESVDPLENFILRAQSSGVSIKIDENQI